MKFLIITGLLCAMITNTAMGSDIIAGEDDKRATAQKGMPYTLNFELLAQARHPVSSKMINALWHHFKLKDTAETYTRVMPPYDSNIVVRFSFPTVIQQMQAHLPDVSFDSLSGQLINHASFRASHNAISAREVVFVVCDYLLQLQEETVMRLASQILPSRLDFLGKTAL